MEPEDSSLPYSQEAITRPYPKSDESNPTLPLYFPKIHSNILPSSPMSSEWFISLRVSKPTFCMISHRSHAC